MTNGPAEGGVISKEIERIFQRVREIIDENQKKEQGPERCLEQLQPFLLLSFKTSLEQTSQCFVSHSNGDICLKRLNV